VLLGFVAVQGKQQLPPPKKPFICISFQYISLPKKHIGQGNIHTLVYASKQAAAVTSLANRFVLVLLQSGQILSSVARLFKA
jgi:hypothetical protein